jgi:hypothetical protein
MHIAPPYAHFPFAEDNITTSIAENSIATSGGVKFSQSRMSFALQSTGMLFRRKSEVRCFTISLAHCFITTTAPVVSKKMAAFDLFCAPAAC